MPHHFTETEAETILELGEEKVPDHACISYAQACTLFGFAKDSSHAKELWENPKEFGFTKTLRGQGATRETNNGNAFFGVEITSLAKILGETLNTTPTRKVGAEEVVWDGRAKQAGKDIEL